jgi:hypothetical protein
MKLSGLLFILWSATLLLSPLAKAQLPLYDEAGRNYRLGSWQFDAQMSYYQATANYTKSGGQYVSLPGSNSYSLLDFDFGSRWVPKSQWAFYASSRVSNAESKDAINTRKESSLSQIVLGTDFLFYNSPRMDLYPDLSITIPLKRVEPNADTTLNAEGAMEITGKIVGRLNWGIFDPFAFVGFTFRDEDRSSLLPFGAGAELQFGRWRFGGELRGYQTVIHDKFEKNPYQREIVANRNGGALRYYSVDPSLLETNLWLRGNLTPTWAMKIGGGTSLTGSSVAAGWNLFGGMTYSPQFSPGRSSPIVTPYKERPTEEVDKFEEETSDGVDQELFNKPPPPPPPPKPKTVLPPPAPPDGTEAPRYSPSVNDAEAPLYKKPKKVARRATPQQRKKSVQNELDAAEFQIELKTTKKKPRR